MTTLFFCNLRPEKDGAFERVLSSLAQLHHAHKDRLVLALAGQPIPEVAQRFHAAKLEWMVVPGWCDDRGQIHPWAFVLPGLRLIQSIKPDVAVVHFGNEMPSLVLSWLSLLLGGWSVRWIWQQDQQISMPGRLTRWVSRIRMLTMRFNRFVVVYQGGLEAMAARGIPAGMIAVIHNGVVDPEPGRWRTVVRAELGIREGTVALMTVGSLIPRKRISSVIQACSLLSPDLPPWRLFIIGDGDERVSLEQLAHRSGLGDKVIFLGRRNDAGRLLCGADVFVHAAMAEGCAYAVSEALAAGVPVLATEAGAVREQVIQSETGFVAAMNDCDEFTERLARLVGDDTMRRKMGVAARLLWLDRFSIDRQTTSLCDLYRSVSGKYLGVCGSSRLCFFAFF